MTAPTGSLPPDEAAYYAAWLGKLWPRYRTLFEPGPVRRRFEWRAALYPLWLGVPGLYVPLAGVVFGVVAAVLVIATLDANLVPSIVVLMTLGLLALWPGIAIALLAITDSGPLLPLLGLGMLAASVVLGFLTPRWIVAEGRRRWALHGASVAAGQVPALPKAVTAFSAPRLIILLIIVGVPFGVLLIPVGSGDHRKVFVAQMKSDLRGLVVAEETFFADSARYTSDLNALEYERNVGVTLRIVSASDSGWTATARHDSSETACAIFIGNVAPPIVGATEGEPACQPSPRH